MFAIAWYQFREELQNWVFVLDRCHSLQFSDMVYEKTEDPFRALNNCKETALKEEICVFASHSSRTILDQGTLKYQVILKGSRPCTFWASG
jgi:hypothetical protein